MRSVCRKPAGTRGQAPAGCSSGRYSALSGRSGPGAMLELAEEDTNLLSDASEEEEEALSPAVKMAPSCWCSERGAGRLLGGAQAAHSILKGPRRKALQAPPL